MKENIGQAFEITSLHHQNTFHHMSVSLTPFQVPPDFVGDRSLVLPPATSEDDIRHGQLYSKCHMYTLANVSSNVLQPDTQPCLYGYEFHFDTPKEWNIIAEVCGFDPCLRFLVESLSKKDVKTDSSSV